MSKKNDDQKYLHVASVVERLGLAAIVRRLSTLAKNRHVQEHAQLVDDHAALVKDLDARLAAHRKAEKAAKKEAGTATEPT